MRTDIRIITTAPKCMCDEHGRVQRALDASRRKIGGGQCTNEEERRHRARWEQIARLIEHWGIG